LRDQSFAKMTQKDGDLIMDVHVKGVFKTTKAVWSHFQKQRYGRIVNTASGSGIFGNYGQANYAATKAAITGFSLTLCLEGANNII